MVDRSRSIFAPGRIAARGDREWVGADYILLDNSGVGTGLSGFDDALAALVADSTTTDDRRAGCVSRLDRHSPPLGISRVIPVSE